MFLNYSSNFPASSFPNHRLSSVLISRLSIGTMGMLRLPSSFSFPSVSLGKDTTYACRLFLSSLQEQQVPCVTQSFVHAVDFTSAFSRVETLGSPVFPCLPYLPLIRSRTPTGPPQLASIAVLVLSQPNSQLRLRY